ncbi:MAG: hypothetical protein GC160_06045 [Acidobacteria bacterium]|nr:hypothetical protein [Acidobacteriota bacterium]
MSSLRRILLCAWASGAALWAQPVPDAQEIIEKAFEASERNEKIEQQYTGNERVEERKLDKDGAVKETESKTFELLYLFGEEYRKLIAKDGEPLPPDEAAKERKKLDKAYAERADESPKERERRLEKQRKDEEEEREFRAEIVKAFDFTLAGEETVAGRRCWIIDGLPRSGYEPSISKAKFLQKIRGRAWISQDDYNWVRAEVETIDNASFGGFIVKLKEGAKLDFTQSYVNDEVWLPTSFRLRFEAKLVLLKGLRREIDVRWSDFRKFQAESTLIAQ